MLAFLLNLPSLSRLVANFLVGDLSRIKILLQNYLNLRGFLLLHLKYRFNHFDALLLSSRPTLPRQLALLLARQRCLPRLNLDLDDLIILHHFLGYLPKVLVRLAIPPRRVNTLRSQKPAARSALQPHRPFVRRPLGWLAARLVADLDCFLLAGLLLPPLLLGRRFGGRCFEMTSEGSRECLVQTTQAHACWIASYLLPGNPYLRLGRLKN